MARLAEQGRAAVERRDWDEAWRCYSAATETDATADLLEGLSWAAWWRADTDAMFDARERAYRAYRAAGRDVDAARLAMWLGTDSLDFRGHDAVARGWLGRARSLLVGHEESAEYGWLCLHEAEKLIFAGDCAGAIEHSEEAITLARALDEPDLGFLATATIGLAQVFAGEVASGASRLEDAGAAAIADEIAETVVAGWCCCYLIYGFEQMHDYDRAAQWCRQITAWASSRSAVLNFSCRAHHASVLMFSGDWAGAESELLECSARLWELRPPAAVDATARLGELRRRQRRFDEARDLFEQATGHPVAIVGMGELCLDRADPVGARERAEEYLRDGFAGPSTPRTAGLDLLARAAAAAGDLAVATAALDELGEVCDRVGTAHGRACHALAGGFIAEAAGDPDQARTAFEDAVRLFHRIGAPWEEARARMQLARLLHDARRDDDASSQEDAATRLLDSIRGRRPTPGDRRTAAGDDLLTPREREVLRLVAQGMTNRGIATELVVSEHTVNRHMTNILTKLDTGSRSAAVARALRDGLI